MLMKLFVFGMPGSGKSTVSRSTVEYVHQKYPNWFARHFSDYDILREMFRQDTEHKNFSPEEYKGFYVTNPEMYDEALRKLQQSINQVNPAGNQLVLIEFSRGDYAKSLKHFESSFSQNAAYLFIYSDINTCLERIAHRIKHPHYGNDDHYVPERTFERFANTDTEEYPQSLHLWLVHSYGEKNSRFKIIDSRGSKESTQLQAKVFVDEIISLSQTPIPSNVKIFRKLTLNDSL
jgi:adenylate kinase family enzyme